jgi:hypothetical protein
MAERNQILLLCLPDPGSRATSFLKPVGCVSSQEGLNGLNELFSISLAPSIEVESCIGTREMRMMLHDDADDVD